MAAERVQKILAQAGIASRRKAEELIAEGLVTINGKVALPGDKADLAHDAIKVKGKLLLGSEPPVYFAFYKPRGVISMLADPDGRPTIADFLPKTRSRVFPIGRLDYNSEGLILLTNDGELAERIQKNDQIARVYHIKVKGHPTPDMMKRLGRGGKVGDRRVRLHSARIDQELASKAVIEAVALGAGGSDHKSFFESKGFLVEKVTRVALGQITIHGLKPGEIKPLQRSQLLALIEHPELGMRLVDEAAEKGAVIEQKRAFRRAHEAEKVEYEERRERVRARIDAARTSRDDRDERPSREPRDTRPARRTTTRDEGGSRKVIPARQEWTGDRFGRAERGPKPASGKPAFGKPAFARGDRPERGPKPAFRKPDFARGDHPERGPKPAFGRSDRPERGPKPAFGRSERGDRPERGPKPAFGKPDFARGDRPERGPKPAARGGRRSMNDGDRGAPSKGIRPKSTKPASSESKPPRSRKFKDVF